jgi:hypothetical protein
MTLKQFIAESGLSECEAMNRLQNHGIVSDEAVWADDVAPSDHDRAIAFLRRATQDFRLEQRRKSLSE